MAKEKLTLSELKVQSFVTTLEDAQMSQVKGGYLVVRGRRLGYSNTWTFVDTRVNVNDISAAPKSTIGG